VAPCDVTTQAGSEGRRCLDHSLVASFDHPQDKTAHVIREGLNQVQKSFNLILVLRVLA